MRKEHAVSGTSIIQLLKRFAFFLLLSFLCRASPSVFRDSSAVCVCETIPHSSRSWKRAPVLAFIHFSLLPLSPGRRILRVTDTQLAWNRNNNVSSNAALEPVINCFSSFFFFFFLPSSSFHLHEDLWRRERMLSPGHSSSSSKAISILLLIIFFLTCLPTIHADASPLLPDPVRISSMHTNGSNFSSASRSSSSSMLLSSSASSTTTTILQSFDRTLSPRQIKTKYGFLRGILISHPAFTHASKNSQQQQNPSSSNNASSHSNSYSSTYSSSFASRQQNYKSLLGPVEGFLGVPYASPPVGSLRFMPPVTPSHWRGVRMANNLGPSCPQKVPRIINNLSPGRIDYLKRLKPFIENQSEDCLYLNAYTPYDRGKCLFSFLPLSLQAGTFLFREIDMRPLTATRTQCIASCKT